MRVNDGVYKYMYVYVLYVKCASEIDVVSMGKGKR
jgi:hypothetical protein